MTNVFCNRYCSGCVNPYINVVGNFRWTGTLSRGGGGIFSSCIIGCNTDDSTDLTLTIILITGNNIRPIFLCRRSCPS